MAARLIDTAQASTTVNLNATYDNGVLGVGATLTDASGTFAAFVIDGYTGVVGEIFLVQFQSAPEENGLYELTTNGDDISIPWVLTRDINYDEAAEVAYGDYTSVMNGSESGVYMQVSPGPFTIGTTAIVFEPITVCFVPFGFTDGAVPAFNTTPILQDSEVLSTNIIYGQDGTVAFGGLSAGGQVTLVTAGSATAQYRISQIFMDGTGTNFSGGGGDRDIAISDGTTVYTVMPAVNVQTLTNAAWGSTEVPYPASDSVNTPTVAGANIYAYYTGGTADYTAGSMTISLELRRVTL